MWQGATPSPLVLKLTITLPLPSSRFTAHAGACAVNVFKVFGVYSKTLNPQCAAVSHQSPVSIHTKHALFWTTHEKPSLPSMVHRHVSGVQSRPSALPGRACRTNHGQQGPRHAVLEHREQQCSKGMLIYSRAPWPCHLQ